MPGKQGFFPPGKRPANPAPYTPGIVVGDQVFVAGQGPLDTSTNQIIGTTIEEQVEVTLNNVKRILEAAGAKMDDCVKVTAYLAHMEDFDRYNAVYRKFFNEPRPARTTVEAKLWGGILVEIDAIAIKGSG